MTIHVNIGEAKTRLSELVAAALRGEEVIVQRDGQPKVRLVPLPEAEAMEREALAAKRRAAFGFAREKYAHLPPEAFDVPPSMTDEEIEERYQRKFGAPSD
ncbi:MAG TPA: type II toxin-antitoxin system prevent-host-death family antitoxin [Sphingopyxis sp.]|nr:type II toxin-antitoxin system prevent-host-death family antitoxin [Sphingopyxis sp.]HMQ18474.1 type II toxin-antitoxin system prevent-host-death family antitoxin [Sphingopyxis sp.]